MKKNVLVSLFSILMFPLFAQIDVDVNRYVDNAIEFLKENKIDSALNCFDELLASYPNMDDYYKYQVYYGKAEIYFHNNEFDKALENLDIAIDMPCNSYRAYYLKGIIFDKKGFYSEAIELLSKSIEKNKNYADSYLARGIIYFNSVHMQKTDESKSNYLVSAQNDFIAALDIDDNNYMALYMISVMGIYFVGDYEFSANRLTKCILNKPNFVDAYYLRALCYCLPSNIQNPNKAFADCNAYISLVTGGEYLSIFGLQKGINDKISYSLSTMYLFRSVFYKAGHKYDECIKDISSAIELQPDEPDYYKVRYSYYNNQISVSKSKKEKKIYSNLAEKDLEKLIALGVSIDDNSSIEDISESIFYQHIAKTIKDKIDAVTCKE